jgi:hypothetical protein
MARFLRPRPFDEWLFFRFDREPMCDDGTADLLDLIHLGLTAAGLEVQDLRHAIAGEDVVVAPHTLDEAQMEQQGAKVIEAEVRVRRTAEDAIQGLRDLAHDVISVAFVRSYPEDPFGATRRVRPWTNLADTCIVPLPTPGSNITWLRHVQGTVPT